MPRQFKVATSALGAVTPPEDFIEDDLLYCYERFDPPPGILLDWEGSRPVIKSGRAYLWAAQRLKQESVLATTFSKLNPEFQEWLVKVNAKEVSPTASRRDVLNVLFFLKQASIGQLKEVGDAIETKLGEQVRLTMKTVDDGTGLEFWYDAIRTDESVMFSTLASIHSICPLRSFQGRVFSI